MPILVALLSFAAFASAQTWCGKNYKPTAHPVIPGGQFLVPATSPSPLLAFHCAPAVRPYLPEDATSPPTPSFISIIVDSPLINSDIANAAAISSTSGSLSVTVTLTTSGTILATGSVPVNSTGSTLPFSLAGLQPSKTPYSITCKAKTISGESYYVFGSLFYLPTPPAGIGSVIKMDQRTGTLLARPADGSSGPYAPVVSVGFYTSFDNYLAVDFTIPATLKSQGPVAFSCSSSRANSCQ